MRPAKSTESIDSSDASLGHGFVTYSLHFQVAGQRGLSISALTPASAPVWGRKFQCSKDSRTDRTSAAGIFSFSPKAHNLTESFQIRSMLVQVSHGIYLSRICIGSCYLFPSYCYRSNVGVCERPHNNQIHDHLAHERICILS